MSEDTSEKTIVCKGNFGEVVEVKASKLMFRPSIHGILIRGNDVLLCPQWDGWDYPGGGIDKGEKLDDALIREFKEETGLDVKVESLLHVADNFFQPMFDTEQHWHGIKIYFSVSYLSGEISTDGFAKYEKNYMKAAVWVPIEKIAGLKFFNQVNNSALVQMASPALN